MEAWISDDIYMSTDEVRVSSCTTICSVFYFEIIKAPTSQNKTTSQTSAIIFASLSQNKQITMIFIIHSFMLTLSVIRAQLLYFDI